MRTKQTLLATLLVLTVCTFWSLQVGAYGVFHADPVDSGKCSQCHDDWPGATHTTHQSFSCNLCHSGSDPVETSSCLTCHDGSDTMDLHTSFEGPGDAAYCGYCHAGVHTEDHSWGEMKALFR